MKTPKAHGAKTAKLPDLKIPTGGGKSPRFSRMDWGYYAPGMKAPYDYTDAELKRIVRKASKAANQRLRNLEKTGITKYAYKGAMHNLAGRKRFKERTAKLSRDELRREFIILRDFLTAKTSTPAGHRAVQDAKFQRAQDLGFTGTKDELTFLYDKYMTEQMEKMYGSDIINQMIIQNDAEELKRLRMAWETEAKNAMKDKATGGRAILEYMRRQLGRK